MVKQVLLILSLLLLSCEKIPPTYTLNGVKVDSLPSWQNQYVNGGVLPNWSTNGKKNELVGTKWVLTYLQIGFSNPPLPIDTIYFVDNLNYTINGGAIRSYKLYVGVSTSSKTLTLNNHYPFGSGNYSGEVSSTFVLDGVILNSEFHNLNTPTTTIRASFKKI